MSRGTLLGALNFRISFLSREEAFMVIHPLVFKVHNLLRAALEPEQHYLLAVSGGSDSMALLAACWQLQSENWGMSCGAWLAWGGITKGYGAGAALLR